MDPWDGPHPGVQRDPINDLKMAAYQEQVNLAKLIYYNGVHKYMKKERQFRTTYKDGIMDVQAEDSLPISHFDAPMIPSLSPFDYVLRHTQHLVFSVETFVIAIILMHRATFAGEVILSTHSFHRLFTASLFLANKLHEDQQISQNRYSMVAGVDGEELTFLTLAIMGSCSEIHVTGAQFEEGARRLGVSMGDFRAINHLCSELFVSSAPEGDLYSVSSSKQSVHPMSRYVDLVINQAFHGPQAFLGGFKIPGFTFERCTSEVFQNRKVPPTYWSSEKTLNPVAGTPTAIGSTGHFLQGQTRQGTSGVIPGDGVGFIRLSRCSGDHSHPTLQSPTLNATGTHQLPQGSQGAMAGFCGHLQTVQGCGGVNPGSPQDPQSELHSSSPEQETHQEWAGPSPGKTARTGSGTGNGNEYSYPAYFGNQHTPLYGGEANHRANAPWAGELSPVLANCNYQPEPEHQLSSHQAGFRAGPQSHSHSQQLHHHRQKQPMSSFHSGPAGSGITSGHHELPSFSPRTAVTGTVAVLPSQKAHPSAFCPGETSTMEIEDDLLAPRKYSPSGGAGGWASSVGCVTPSTLGDFGSMK